MGGWSRSFIPTHHTEIKICRSVVFYLKFICRRCEVWIHESGLWTNNFRVLFPAYHWFHLQGTNAPIHEIEQNAHQQRDSPGLWMRKWVEKPIGNVVEQSHWVACQIPGIPTLVSAQVNTKPTKKKDAHNKRRNHPGRQSSPKPGVYMQQTDEAKHKAGECIRKKQWKIEPERNPYAFGEMKQIGKNVRCIGKKQ